MDHPPPISSIEDQYEITSLLGKGRTGGVYRCSEIGSNSEFAIRRYSQHGVATDTELFLSRATELQQLQHPHLLPLLQAGFSPDGAFSVSPLYNGDRLSEYASRSQLRESTVRTIALQTLEALSMLHTAGETHGSLSPHSISVAETPDGSLHCLLIDFHKSSLVRALHGSAPETHPAFTSPELHKGAPPTPASDCYQLGHVLFFAHLGGHPWANESASKCIALHRHSRLPAVQQFRNSNDQPFQVWLSRLHSRNPELRFQDATEALEHLKLLPPPPRLVNPDSKPNLPDSLSTPQYPVKLIASLTGLVFLTAVITYFVHQSKSTAATATTATSPQMPQLENPPIHSNATLPQPPPVPQFTLLECKEERSIPNTTLSKHPRLECQLRPQLLDWKVFCHPANTSFVTANSPSLIGIPTLIGSAKKRQQFVGNLLFFSESGTLYRPSLYATCEQSNDGWKIPIKLATRSNSQDLTLTLHFSCWNCSAAVMLSNTESTQQTQSFLYAEKSPYVAYSTRYIIPASALTGIDALSLSIAATSAHQSGSFGISLNALTLE